MMTIARTCAASLDRVPMSFDARMPLFNLPA
jgi:hypothetical protein